MKRTRKNNNNLTYQSVWLSSTMSKIFCFVVSFIRSFNCPATPATLDVTDSRTEDVMDVARERNDETDFVGDVGADVILDLDVNGSDLGGSVVDEVTFASDAGIADVGLPPLETLGDAVDLMDDVILDPPALVDADGEVPGASSSFSLERSPCENLLLR